ncbi:MAG: dockerin type I repeat-containing protein, partial [Candidatus Neomarinimicrobiota bacterium]|nr:dockerin type I repeat-containing protein [Candidatus Neomarinimicrobiota bacterium]
AGHVHVGGLINWATAQEAAKITLREVIRIADQYQTLFGDINQDGTVTIFDMLMLISHILGFSPLGMDEIILADVNFDTEVDIYDLMIISNIILEI